MRSSRPGFYPVRGNRPGNYLIAVLGVSRRLVYQGVAIRGHGPLPERWLARWSLRSS